MFQARSQRRSQLNSRRNRVGHTGQRAHSRRVQFGNTRIANDAHRHLDAAVNLAPVDTIGPMQLMSDGSVFLKKPSASGFTAQAHARCNGKLHRRHLVGIGADDSSTRRIYLREVTLPDGRMLVLGGNQRVPDTGEIYNPLTNSWSDVAAVARKLSKRPDHAVDQRQSFSRLEHRSANISLRSGGEYVVQWSDQAVWRQQRE